MHVISKILLNIVDIGHVMDKKIEILIKIVYNTIHIAHIKIDSLNCNVFILSNKFIVT